MLLDNATPKTPPPHNEPILSYAPGTPERALLKQTLEQMSSETVEVASVIGGKQVRGGPLDEHRSPHDHGKLLARIHTGGGRGRRARHRRRARAPGATGRRRRSRRGPRCSSRAAELLADQVAADPQRRDDARASPRPRTRRRSTPPASSIDFLPLQRALRRAALRRAAALRAGDVERSWSSARSRGSCSR